MNCYCKDTISLKDYKLMIVFEISNQGINPTIPYLFYDYIDLYDFLPILSEDLDKEGIYLNWEQNEALKKLEEKIYFHNSFGYLRLKKTKKIASVKVYCSLCGGFDLEKYKRGDRDVSSI